MKEKICVLGAGTWGIALARMLCLAGHNVQVWSALPEEINELQTTHRHRNLCTMVIHTRGLTNQCGGEDYSILHHISKQTAVAQKSFSILKSF